MEKRVRRKKEEVEVRTGGEGFNQSSSATLEIPKDLFDGTRIVTCLHDVCLRCCVVEWKNGTMEGKNQRF